MELLNQPFTGQLGNRLIELLDSADYHTLNIVVAFAKNSGVLRIKNSLESFRKRGGRVNVYVGIDLGGTSYEALASLLFHTDSLTVVHSEKSQTFHPKIYQFIGDRKGLVIVGSHNLTGGGLWSNFESSVLIPVDGTSTNEELLRGLEGYMEQLASLKNSSMSITTLDDIETLLRKDYVFKEVAERVRRASLARASEGGERFFGNGISVNLPPIVTQKKEKVSEILVLSASEIPVTKNEEGTTIWFETRSMTGGSRNILDLSKESLVERGVPTGTTLDLGKPRFMRGGVQFFGLNPTDTTKSKDITLNFGGIDYLGNTILYPVGENPNGTWRLQIKGESSLRVKITEVFKGLNTAEGERFNDQNVPLLYLQFKIITFTKIQDDYYSMAVFPESDLEKFRAASSILARNGSSASARLLGLL